MAALALSSTCWNTPASKTSGLTLRLDEFAGLSSSGNMHPPSGADTITATSRRAIPRRERTPIRAMASCSMPRLDRYVLLYLRRFLRILQHDGQNASEKQGAYPTAGESNSS